MVATPNLFFKPVSFFDSPSRRDSGCDSWRLHWGRQRVKLFNQICGLNVVFLFSFFFIYLFSFISFFPFLLFHYYFYFYFCLFFYLYILVSILIYLYLSLGMIVCKLFRIFCYISAWEVFWLFCRWGLWYASSSLHTHTLCAYHERGPIPGSV